jgi:hypothetical protein
MDPTKDDLANYTSDELLEDARYPELTYSRIKYLRAQHSIRMTDAAVRRSYTERAHAHDKVMTWPTDEELQTVTIQELMNKYGLTHKQITGRKERLGIRQDDSTRRQSYKEKGQQARLAPKTEQEMIEHLESRGFAVIKELPHDVHYTVPGKPGDHYKFAVVCCTHLGNVHQQISHLHDFYKHAESLGVTEFWNAGDTTDGPDSMHPAMRHEHFKHTFDGAVDYFVSAYPKPKNGVTKLILGNHDEAWLKDGSGSDIGRAIALRRNDIEYIGRRTATIAIGGAKILIMHGHGGGAYARSYRMQKIVEQFSVDRRPDVLLLGNYHEGCYLPNYLGTESFLLPCFESQTPFLAGLGKQPLIAGLVIDMELGQRGIRDIKVDWRVYKQPVLGDYPKS